VVNSRLALVVVALLGAVASVGAGRGVAATPPPPSTQCAPAADYPAARTPVAFWSTEARCAIVPAGPGGVFGPENFGTKFPGEAAVLMGIAVARLRRDAATSPSPPPAVVRWLRAFVGVVAAHTGRRVCRPVSRG